MKRILIGAGLVVAVGAGWMFLSPPAAFHSEPASAAVAAASRGNSGSRTPEVPLVSKTAALRTAVDSRYLDRAAAIERLPLDGERESAVRKLAEDWAAVSPSAAENWAAGLSDPAERQRALARISLTVAGRDPLEAINMVEWHRLEGGLVEAIASQWARRDFDAAEKWATGLAKGPGREEILERIFVERAAADPADAALRVSGAMTPGDVQAEAAIAVLHKWLEVDPAAATEWIAQFPEGPLKERARNEVRGFAAYRAGMK